MERGNVAASEKQKRFVISFESPWKNTGVTSTHKAHCRTQQEGKLGKQRLPQNEISDFSTADYDVIERHRSVRQKKNDWKRNNQVTVAILNMETPKPQGIFLIP